MRLDASCNHVTFLVEVICACCSTLEAVRTASSDWSHKAALFNQQELDACRNRANHLIACALLNWPLLMMVSRSTRHTMGVLVVIALSVGAITTHGEQVKAFAIFWCCNELAGMQLPMQASPGVGPGLLTFATAREYGSHSLSCMSSRP